MIIPKQIEMIKKILNGIIYYPIKEVISKEVTVRQEDTIEIDIYNTLGEILPKDCKYIAPENSFFERRIAKYGIIDAEFLVSKQLQSSYLPDSKFFLKEIEIMDNETEVNETIDKQFMTYVSQLLQKFWLMLKLSFLRLVHKEVTKDVFTILKIANQYPYFLSVLGNISDDIDKQELTLNIFLETGHKYNHKFSMKVPDNYFPHKFLVTDACLTNSGTVWFERNFYL